LPLTTDDARAGCAEPREFTRDVQGYVLTLVEGPAPDHLAVLQKMGTGFAFRPMRR